MIIHLPPKSPPSRFTKPSDFILSRSLRIVLEETDNFLAKDSVVSIVLSRTSLFSFSRTFLLIISYIIRWRSVSLSRTLSGTLLSPLVPSKKGIGSVSLTSSVVNLSSNIGAFHFASFHASRIFGNPLPRLAVYKLNDVIILISYSYMIQYFSTTARNNAKCQYFLTFV